ncbi:MAG TPA: zinc ribbon domain-containing protein [Candidatus Cloacimonadota bacterium]|jgi:hypothetical protein|nr:zinc ribbon domain-containing protein [Candidatus Cloacimonadales bacterium]HPY96212.1 zinc ribbon domain-containing protein [Candidatus Cloacimonadota bacterium]HQB40794.1 zinc ribbon domain-containing protein [Candidatus Cloacimonadota bacterium]
MNCKKCKGKIPANSIFCNHCGTATSFVKENLSASKTIREVFSTYSKHNSKHISFSLITFIFSVVPLILGLYLLHRYFVNIRPFFYYALNLLVISLFMPFWLIALAKEDDFFSKSSHISEYFALLRHYPTQLALCIISSLYLLLLKLICQGDPILNLVHFILIIYGLAIVLHVPSMMFENPICPIKVIKKAYTFGKHTIRWQNVYLSIFIVIVNVPAFLLMLYANSLTKYNMLNTWIISIIALLLGIAYSLIIFPFSWQLIRSQYQKYKDNGILEKNIEKEVS